MGPSDEVECIKGLTPEWHRAARQWRVTPPVVGQRYTVRSICKRRETNILLVGLRNPTVRFSGGKGWAEASFPSRNFRLIRRYTTEMRTTVDQWLEQPTGGDEWDNRVKRKVNV
jgi:hypothetical protein